MAILGIPFKITYWAKNAQSGLTSITAKVMRPDGAIIGPLILTEVADAFFAGSYTATYTPGVSDPEGNYIIALSSPGESSHKAFKTEYFEAKADIDISGLDIAINRRQAIEATTESKLQVIAEAESKDMIAVFEESSSVQAYFYKDDLEKFLDNTQYIGETE